MTHARKPFVSETDPIFSYSRELALTDGVLIDVTERAREAGFRYPVALTAALWAIIETLPQHVTQQEVSGRLWNVLTVGSLAARQSTPGATELLYTLEMPGGPYRTLTIKLVCGPGDRAEPVITLMLLHED